MGQKEFFINAIELVDVHGGTNIPTVVYYRQRNEPSVGNEALSLARDREDLNEDFKVDLGNQKSGSLSVRRFYCADKNERSAGEITASFLQGVVSNVSPMARSTGSKARRKHFGRRATRDAGRARG